MGSKRVGFICSRSSLLQGAGVYFLKNSRCVCVCVFFLTTSFMCAHEKSFRQNLKQGLWNTHLGLLLLRKCIYINVFFFNGAIHVDEFQHLAWRVMRTTILSGTPPILRLIARGHRWVWREKNPSFMISRCGDDNQATLWEIWRKLAYRSYVIGFDLSRT